MSDILKMVRDMAAELREVGAMDDLNKGEVDEICVLENDPASTGNAFEGSKDETP